MEAFLLSLGLIFVAELGDKTQLVALTLATRFNAWVVLAGVLVATLLVHAFSVLLGEITGSLLSPGWLQLLCGLAFIGFGLWTLRGDMAEDGNSRINRLQSPFVIVTLTFFLAELGDKTMLATVTLAAKYPALQVWLGSTLGMVLSDALAIWVGQALKKKLPEKAVKIGAAIIFFGVGFYYALEGANELWQILPCLKVLGG
jgi:putative Ca2+/H+ antiporter (TMEM165/GDT1 family)